jgi:hypothetical protein
VPHAIDIASITYGSTPGGGLSEETCTGVGDELQVGILFESTLSDDPSSCHIIHAVTVLDTRDAPGAMLEYAAAVSE